jgi:yeast amino acid transporter
MKVQGQNIDEIPFKAVLGVWGSYVGLTLNILCVMANLFISISPPGGAKPTATDFFQNNLALPIVVLFYVFWKVFKMTSIVKLSEIDLVTGRKELDLAALKAEEDADKATWPWWKKYVVDCNGSNHRLYYLLC